MRSSNTSPDSLWLRALAVCLAAGLVTAAWAIDPERATSQYLRDHWGPEQGFPRGPVYAITQTADGYLWIATEAGLVRFDGWSFRIIADTSGTFSITGVLGLLPDREGNLWVRLQGPMMLRYRDGVFASPLSDSTYSNITAMCQSNQGALLASAPERGAITYRNGRFSMFADAAALPRSPVMSIAQTGDGAVWMGTRDAGLFRLSSGKPLAITQGLPDPKINCLLTDGAQGLWIGTDDGIVRWDGKSLVRPHAGIQPHTQALAMARDRDGNIWVGTNAHRLLRINSQGVTPLDTGAFRPGDAVTAVFEDREGNVWAGGAGGIERLRDTVFVTYTASEGMPSESNGPVFADAQGRTWFAPVAGGLYWLDKGRSRGRVTTAGLESDVVYSITGSGTDLWIGRQRNGLTHLQPVGESFTARTYTQADGLAQNSVYSVHQSRDGSVWAGTLSGGVSRFHKGVFTTYTSGAGLASNTVASILEGADGTMWFATPNGLSALSKDRWRTYAVADGLPSANVNSLLEDSQGVLWIGTTSGLAFLKAGRIQVAPSTPQSLRVAIFGIAEDPLGSLWVSAAASVVRVHRDKLMRGKPLGDGDVREYGRADGLLAVEGVKRHRSVVADPLGRIWFSMHRGLSVVDPARPSGSAAPAIAHVQSITADGTPMELRDPVRIPAGSRRVGLSFVGLSLSVPDRVRFRYRLDPFDRDWNTPVSAREAVYTNLSPGAYKFQVLASNPDGVWNGTAATLGFRIEPEFWQAWWFRMCAVLAVVLAIVALYQSRMRQLAGELNVRFEERLAERTRIAQELHDTLLQGFLSASMQLHVASDQVADNSPAKPRLNRVLQLMAQVIEEGRNAVRGLRSSHSSSLDLEQAFCQIVQELAIDPEIKLRVITEGQRRPLHPVLRDEVYRIGREALVNAFRHSKARSIEVEIDYGPRQFRLLVRDDGCGIDPAVLKSGREGHWGLPGMRERSEAIGAKLHVWSSATAGTEVVLSVPGHIAYQSALPRRPWKWLARLTSRKDKNQ